MLESFDVKKNYQKEPPSKVLIKWEVREDERVDWRWQVGVNFFLVFSFGFFLLQRNYWGAGLVILILFVILGFQSQKKVHFFSIEKEGIKIDDEFLPFLDLKSFWIFENPPELFLKKKKGISPWFSLPIKEKDKEQIEKILEDFLPKRKQERKFLDILARKIGF